MIAAVLGDEMQRLTGGGASAAMQVPQDVPRGDHAADTSAIGVWRRAARRPRHHKTGRRVGASTMTKILDPANANGCAIPCI